jgi:hypothetical protein
MTAHWPLLINGSWIAAATCSRRWHQGTMVLPRVRQGIDFIQRDESDGELRITGDDNVGLLLWGCAVARRASRLDHHRDEVPAPGSAGRRGDYSDRGHRAHLPGPAPAGPPEFEATTGTVVPRRSPDARVAGTPADRGEAPARPGAVGHTKSRDLSRTFAHGTRDCRRRLSIQP